MSIKWTIDDNKTKIMLKYNVYIGTFKLFINDKLSLKKVSFSKNTDLKFKVDETDYTIELTPYGYGFNALLKDSNNIEYSPVNERKVYKRIPLWIIPFALVNFSIPVLSVEAFTPWLIAVISTYINIKLSETDMFPTALKIVFSCLISVLAWVASYLYYGYAVRSGIHGGFLPF